MFDATATPSSLASLKSIMVLPFWCWLTHAVLVKRPLNVFHMRYNWTKGIWWQRQFLVITVNLGAKTHTHTTVL